MPNSSRKKFILLPDPFSPFSLWRLSIDRSFYRLTWVKRAMNRHYRKISLAAQTDSTRIFYLGLEWWVAWKIVWMSKIIYELTLEPIDSAELNWCASSDFALSPRCRKRLYQPLRPCWIVSVSNLKLRTDLTLCSLTFTIRRRKLEECDLILGQLYHSYEQYLYFKMKLIYFSWLEYYIYAAFITWIKKNMEYAELWWDYFVRTGSTKVM